MILFAAIILGMTFGAAGLIAKSINSVAGAQIANRRMHAYLTRLGSLSNLVLPIVMICIAAAAQGVAGGCMAIVGLLLGAFLVGVLRLPYPFRLLLATVGVPIAMLIFLANLG